MSKPPSAALWVRRWLHSHRPDWGALARFLFLTVIFATAYTQSPLFTSNQNQYFLHGLAAAGRGFLAGDWLANTLDPTPVFSAIVYFTERFLGSDLFYYGYYALLLGIYLYSLIGIVALIFNIYTTRLRSLVYLSLIVTMHSAALRFALSTSLGDNWKYVLEDGVADQRLLGPVLQPSAFGVLLVLSIYLFLRHRPYLAVLSAVLAASIHPTYLLSAASLTLAYLWVSWQDAGLTLRRRRNGHRKKPASNGFHQREVAHLEPMHAQVAETPTPPPQPPARPQLKTAIKSWPAVEISPEPRPLRRLAQPALIGLLALAAVAPILFYVYGNFGDTPPATTAQAQAILVEYRIPHHAQVGSWFDATAVIKILLVAAALYFVRRTRLFPVLLVPAVIAAGLTLLQAVLDSNLLALIFPWRLSVFLVPLSTALVLASLMTDLFDQYHRAVRRNAALLRTMSIVLITAVCLIGGVRMLIEFWEKAHSPERPLMAYVAANNSPEQVYLTPVKMQDFRLATGSPVFVDFKSIPYRDQDVLAWRERVVIADRFYKEGDCAALEAAVQEGGVTHVVVPADGAAGMNCPGWQPVWGTGPQDPYAIYARSEASWLPASPG